MKGEIYLTADARGWFVIHESGLGDSSGIDGPFPSRMSAVIAGRDMAARLDARFKEGEAGQVLAFTTAAGRDSE